MSHEIEELQAALRRFAAERDWGQFHSPKNLAVSLSIEAAGVLEHLSPSVGSDRVHTHLWITRRECT